MRDYLTLAEVAEIPGMPTADALRSAINRGEIKGIKVPKGSRMTWALPTATVEFLKQQNNNEADYFDHIESWKREQRAGYRRPSPLKENTIERNEFGLISFWDYLDGVKPCHQNELKERRRQFAKDKSIDRITLANIMEAISNVPRERMATREDIYKATMSFYRSLVHKGLKSETDLLRFKDFKPAPNKRPKRTVVKDDEAYQNLLLTNQSWYGGRSKYDRLLTDILLRTAYLTGKRNSEICHLMLKDVDFRDQIIYVWDSKFEKDREIGIDPALLEPLKAYHEKRPKSTHKNFFLQEDGKPLNRRIVLKRIKGVAEKAGLDLTPHGMRRAFITNLLMEGAPTVLVQKIVGHNHLTTTEKYNMATARDALDLLRKRRDPEPTPAMAGTFEF